MKASKTKGKVVKAKGEVALDAKKVYKILKDFHDQHYTSKSNNALTRHLVSAFYNEFTRFGINATKLSDGMSFGVALDAMKRGNKVAREGWNGKGMYIWLLKESDVKREHCHDERLLEAFGKRDVLPCLGSIRMFTADKKVLTGWLASQTDMLANDWHIVE